MYIRTKITLIKKGKKKEGHLNHIFTFMLKAMNKIESFHRSTISKVSSKFSRRPAIALSLYSACQNNYECLLNYCQMKLDTAYSVYNKSSKRK